MLERAEQRSKALGITNKTKTPFADSNSDLSYLSQSTHSLKSQASPPKKTPSPSKRTTNVQTAQCGNENIKISTSTSPRKRSSDTKENVDIEINITTGSNVQVNRLNLILFGIDSKKKKTLSNKTVAGGS